MHIPFLVAFSALIFACRLAAGGEGGAPPSIPDPASLFWRAIGDFGPLGLFLGYLILREHKHEKTEEERETRDAERQETAEERFRFLDHELLNMVEKYSTVVTEMHGILTEMRALLKEHNSELRCMHIILAGRACPDAADVFRGDALAPASWKE